MNYKRILGAVFVLQVIAKMNGFADTLDNVSVVEKENLEDSSSDNKAFSSGDSIEGGINETEGLPELATVPTSENKGAVTQNLSVDVEVAFGLVSAFNDKLHFLSEETLSLGSVYINKIAPLANDSKILNKTHDFAINFRRDFLAFEKKISLLGRIERGDGKLDVSKVYIKNDVFKFGRDKSIFNDAGVVWGGYYMSKMDKGCSMCLGIEEFLCPKPVEYKTDSLKDPIGRDHKYSIFKNSVSYALVPQISCENDLGKFALTGLVTYADISRSGSEASNQKLFYGANLNLKFVLHCDEFLKKKEQDIMKVKFQYVDGMSKYVKECDLPRFNDIDFIINGKQLLSTSILSAGLGFDHIWSEEFSSAISVAGFYFLDNKKFENGRKSPRWFGNALAITVLPFSYTMNEFFKITPSYKAKVGNLLNASNFNGGLLIAHGLGLNFDCNLKLV